MAEPVEDKVFFAGEATIRLYPSSVQGAYLSGKREATRILGRKGLLTPPRLSVRMSGPAQADISWPTNAPGYILEGSGNLPADDWTMLTNTPSVQGSNYVVRDLPADAARFYRLWR